MRNFAPLYGIPEEAATGTSNASLTHYLHQSLHLTAPAECTFVQGEAMKRTSVIHTHLAADGTISVGGKAAVVARGELTL